MNDKIKLQTLKKGNDMDKNLKNALIIIAVLVGVYYLISPYQNCMRGADEWRALGWCTINASW